MFYVYILSNAQEKLYVGHTNNPNRRLREHKNQSGARFMRGYEDYRLLYSEQFASRSEAMKREKQLKGWRRDKKIALIAGDLKLLKKL